MYAGCLFFCEKKDRKKGNADLVRNKEYRKICYLGYLHGIHLQKEVHMTIREQLEIREKETLSPFAFCSIDSAGRDRPEPACELRTAFQRDRDRILHSKAFRRLNNKTQVFLAAQGDHYRTRLTHTLEVSQIARTIAKALYLNEDLTEAIALGHDLGHTPFGHSGERALNKYSSRGFRHNVQSVRVVELLERDGRGLNLTKEVRDGILNHQTAGKPSTLEGQVVRLSDKIAYIHHDMDDAIRAGVINEDHIPITLRMRLGGTNVERLDTMVHDVVSNSRGKDCVEMSGEIHEAMMSLRRLMFDNVYTSSLVKAEESKAIRMLGALLDYYRENPQEMSDECREMMARGESVEQAACDYISGMTDQYFIHKYKDIFVLKGWQVN